VDNKTKGLVTVSAAAATNCRPCLEYHAPQCIKVGNSEEDLLEAIETGFEISRSAQIKTRESLEGVVRRARENTDGSKAGCCDEGSRLRKCCCRGEVPN
jgi:AhpD family alkylhydroperoxidase